MATLTPSQLTAASNAVYFDNVSGSITPTSVRGLNTDWISSSILASMTSSMTVGTASYFSGSISNAVSSSYAGTASVLLGSVVSASYALSSSFALTASYALNAGTSINTSSFATTGSNVFNGNQTITGSINVSSNVNATNVYAQAVIVDNITGVNNIFGSVASDLELISITNRNIGLNAGTGVVKTYSNLQVTGSIKATAGFTGSLQGTSSFALTASFFSGSISNAISSSYAATASVLLGSVVSASYALSASLAQTASFVTTAQTASFVLNAVSASRAVTSSFAISSSNALTASVLLGSVVSASYAVSSSNALTASFALNAGGGSSFPFTGSAIISGSLEVTGSISTNAPVFINNSVLQVAGGGITPNTNTFGDGTLNIVELVSTASVGFQMFIDDTAGSASYDTFQIIVESGLGTIFADVDGTTYGYRNWLKVPSNALGTNPAPQFLTGLLVTGSLNAGGGITGSLLGTASFAQTAQAAQTALTASYLNTLTQPQVTMNGSLTAGQNFTVTNINISGSPFSPSVSCSLAIQNLNTYQFGFNQNYLSDSLTGAQFIAETNKDAQYSELKFNARYTASNDANITVRNVPSGSDSIATINTVKTSILGSLNVAGNLLLASGSNKTTGIVTLNGGNPGTVTVSNSLVGSTSMIFLTKQTNASTGSVAISAKSGGSFTITSTSNGDADQVAYMIVNPG